MGSLKDILTKISSWFKSKAPDKSSSSIYKWILGIFMGALSLFGLAYAAYVQWKHSKLIAKLLHDRDLAAEDVKQKELEKKTQEHQVFIDIIDQDIKLLKIKEETLKAQAAKAEADHKTIKEQIDDIKNWDDADRFNSSH